MKKTILSTVILSTFLLAGCNDNNPKTMSFELGSSLSKIVAENEYKLHSLNVIYLDESDLEELKTLITEKKSAYNAFTNVFKGVDFGSLGNPELDSKLQEYANEVSNANEINAREWSVFEQAVIANYKGSVTTLAVERERAQRELDRFNAFIKKETDAVMTNQQQYDLKTEEMSSLFSAVYSDLTSIIDKHGLWQRNDESINPLEITSINSKLHACESDSDKVEVEIDGMCYQYNLHSHLAGNDAIMSVLMPFAKDHAKVWSVRDELKQKAKPYQVALYYKRQEATEKFGRLIDIQAKLNLINGRIDAMEARYVEQLSIQSKTDYLGRQLNGYRNRVVDEFAKLVEKQYDTKFASLKGQRYTDLVAGQSYPLQFEQYDYAVMELDYESTSFVKPHRADYYNMIDMRGDAAPGYAIRDLSVKVQDFINFEQASMTRSDMIEYVLTTMH
ncbi:hypothetical protein [Vibrio barjaei]|uniref:hypothetical protein n=1 Tax=Vibrio barjaei TaxID=1676683 RepID=UPI0022851D60|nr:hypothetical protein [Vibrio barjaei]MCY9870401.1 hypothetical protein [Vibrio barjaei]